MRVPIEDWSWFLTHLGEAHEDTLSVWEIDFVDSLQTQITRTQSLSPRQVDVLQRLQQRCPHLRDR